MDNQQEKVLLQLGWLAGIVDGEGHITLARQAHKSVKGGHYYKPMIVISNTNPSIIAEVVAVSEMLNLPHYVLLKRAWRDERWAQAWCYQITGLLRCQTFLKALEPYLIGKKTQAQIVLEFIRYRLSQPRSASESRGERDDAFKELIGRANQVFNSKNTRAILRDHMPTTAEEAGKIWSDLQGDLQKLAEMTGSAFQGE